MLNDLPDAIRRMEIISADLAALALTGLLPAETVEQAIRGNYINQERGTDGQDAKMYKTAIINAVRNSSLSAHSVSVDREMDLMIIHQKELRTSDRVTDVEVFSKELWLWLNKPSSNSKDVDPLAELNSIKSEFISLKEMFDIFKNKYPHMTINQIAEWMVKKFCYENNVQVYSQGIAGKLYEMGNDYYGDDNPFLMDLLEKVINHGESVFSPTTTDNKSAIPFGFDDDIPF